MYVTLYIQHYSKTYYSYCTRQIVLNIDFDCHTRTNNLLPLLTCFISRIRHTVSYCLQHYYTATALSLFYCKPSPCVSTGCILTRLGTVMDEPLESSASAVCGTSFVHALCAGAAAGLAVDVTLLPVDALKTRLQARTGFWSSGGFSRLYAGIPSVAVGSAPGSALFFCTYEYVRNFASRIDPSLENHVGVNVAAASLAEVAACFVRVPTELVKQRAQAGSMSTREVFMSIWREEGLPRFYRGFRATVIREVPFSFIQFPLWEYLKQRISAYRKRSATPLESATCGCVAGAIAACVTTPLDVAKTRIMLSRDVSGERVTTRGVLANVLRHEGIRGLFAGVLPRTFMIGVGGFIFLGAYDLTKDAIDRVLYGVTARESDLRNMPISKEFAMYRVYDYVYSFYDNVFRVDPAVRTEPKSFEEAQERALIKQELRRRFDTRVRQQIELDKLKWKPNA